MPSGREVRFDGGHKRNEFLVETFENISIGMLRSLISDGMRAKLMTANDWRGRSEPRNASDYNIASQ